jgi:hypothetical protein
MLGDKEVIEKLERLQKIISDIEEISIKNGYEKFRDEFPDAYSGDYWDDGSEGAGFASKQVELYLLYFRLATKTSYIYPTIVDEEPFFSKTCDHNFLKLDYYLVKDANNRIKILKIQTPTANGELYKNLKQNISAPYESIQYATEILPLELDTFSCPGQYHNFHEKLACGCYTETDFEFFVMLSGRLDDFLEVLIRKMESEILPDFKTKKFQLKTADEVNDYL